MIRSEQESPTTMMMMMSSDARTGRALLRRAVALWVALVAVLVCAASAQASLTLQSGYPTFGLSTSQAGAHPDVTTSFMFTTTTAAGSTIVDGSVKEVHVSLPAGLVGTPAGIPECPGRLLSGALGICPPGAQVGTVTVTFNLFGSPFPGTAGLYNMKPSNGTTAQLGFSVYGNPMIITARVRPGDAGLTLSINNVPQALEILGTSVTVWGVPADPSHDAERFSSLFSTGIGAGVARQPFMTNPTECSGQPLKAGFAFNSWEQTDTVITGEADGPAMTDCAGLHFDPTVNVTPTVSQVDSPSGYAVRIGVPQDDNPDGRATANLRKAVVKLPAGVTLSPSVADGLQACTDDQLSVASNDDPACPAGSKLGSATLHTPALDEPLDGTIYLGQPKSDDPYRLFIVLQGSGVTIKLRGSVTPDAQTGQLTTTFDDNPQQPFSDLTLRFKSGPRAPLTTPVACGTATTTTALTPWSSTVASTPSDVFQVSWDGNGGACPATLPFTPGFAAGVTNPVAGAYSPFVFRVTRDDRNQTLGRISDVHLPAGLTAKVTGVPLCDDAAAAAGSCGAGSQIGSATVASGPGSSPLHLGGKVFLTKGYKGAPFGLSIVVPAIAGPFDLGTVVVRAAVKVNPDASLSVDADSLPTMLQGIPLRLRDIVLNLDRAGFMLNPTSCDPMNATAKIAAVEGAVANVTDRFQLSGCGSLGFKPHISATTNAGNSNSKGASLHVTVAGRDGDANLRTVKFTLPSQMGANLNTTKNACDQADYDAGKCGPLAKVGTAKAVTAILPEPMTGDVYLVGQKGALPKLEIMLKGNGITIPLNGAVSFAGNRTVTTFDAIPDVPITRFDLDLPMGQSAAITSTVNVCNASLTAPTYAIGQNGKALSQSTRVVADGCRLRVAKTKVGHTAARLTISGIKPGRLTVGGSGVITAKRTLRSASVATVTVKLTAAAKRALQQDGSLRVAVKVTNAPADGGKTQSVSKTITFKK